MRTPFCGLKQVYFIQNHFFYETTFSGVNLNSLDKLLPEKRNI